MHSIKNKLKKLVRKESIIVIFDFDYTITTQNSNSSIAIFSNYLPKGYRRRKSKIDYVVNKINSEKMYRILWYLKLKLLKKYDAKSILSDIDYKNEFVLNEKTIDIIDFLNNIGASIIIYSSGIKEIITRIFDIYSVNYDNIKIIANSLYGDSDLITPYKKKISGLDNKIIVLVGDNKKDLSIVNTDYLIEVINDTPTIIKWG